MFFFQGLTRDILHSTGLCILVFFVLPTFAPDVASLVGIFVAIGPGFLQPICRVKALRNDNARRNDEESPVYNEDKPPLGNSNDQTINQQRQSNGNTGTPQRNESNGQITSQNGTKTEQSSSQENQNNRQTISGHQREQNSESNGSASNSTGTHASNSNTNESKERDKWRSREKLFVKLNILGIFVLAAGIGMYVYSVINFTDPYFVVLFGTGIIFTSTEWVENFVALKPNMIVSKRTEKSDKYSAKIDVESTSSFSQCVYMFIACRKETETWILALVKVLTLNLVFLPCVISIQTGKSPLALFQYSTTFLRNVFGEPLVLDSVSPVSYGCWHTTPFIMMALCVGSTILFFKLSQHACRIMLQRSLFAFPVWLTMLFVPVICYLIIKDPNDFTVNGCNVLQPLLKVTEDIGDESDWLLRMSALAGTTSMILIFDLRICGRTN